MYSLSLLCLYKHQIIIGILIENEDLQMKQERLQEIDVLIAIAFIFVVVQHTLGGYS
jgi:hypothetical protein